MNYIERVYPWLLLSPIVLPVVMWGGLIYPYLVPKTLLFYAISLITVGMFGLLVAHGRAFYWARLTRPETWIPAALLVLAYVASMYGIDFYRSFWSLFIRGDGLLMLTCAVASFYLLLLYVDRAFFERLLRVVAVVASFVAVYGIGEWLITGGRIGSLLGNAAFFAGYLGIAIFATLASAQGVSLSWRRAVYTGAVLQSIAIILTATRGTIIALTVAGVISLAYFAFVGKGKQRARSVGMLAALVLLGGLLFAFRAELSKVSFEPVARIASISLSDGTVSSRLFIWKNMVTEIQKSPWLGVGAEHIDSLFNRFYDPTQIYEQWFDRSHNAFLDYTAQYGIGGLLLYLALIASFIIPARRLAARGESRVAGIFVLLAIVYAIQNFFVFDTVSSFWLLLALLAALIALSRNESRLEILPVAPWTRGASWVFALVLLYCIVPVSVRPALAAYNLAHAYTYQIVDVPTQINYLSRGLAQETYGDLEYGYQIYDMYSNQQAAPLSEAARADAYQAAVNILSANFHRYQYDGRTALALAHVLSLAPQSIPVDQNLLSAALTRAIERSPKRSQPWYILANLSIRNANAYPPRSKEHVAGYAAARDILSSYITLVPTLAAPHFVLAQLLYASGNTAGAEREALKGKMGYTSDLETARRAAMYYETVLDLPNAAYFLAEILRLDPSDEGARSDLEKIKIYESR